MKKENTVAEIRISYSSEVDLSNQPRITRSFQAYEILRKSWDDDQIEYMEQFKVLLLAKSNAVIGVVHISSGGVSGTSADPKLIFGAAIKANASGIVLCHNHPSGSLSPSKADIALTIKIVEGAKFFDLVVHDHVILNKSAYLSMADEGIL